MRKGAADKKVILMVRLNKKILQIVLQIMHKMGFEDGYDECCVNILKHMQNCKHILSRKTYRKKKTRF